MSYAVSASRSIEDMSAAWHKVANAADVPAGGALQVRVGSELIAVYNLDGRLYATSDICTHRDAFLSEGCVEGETVECPLHQALFHIPTGKVLREPADVDLKTYPVHQKDGFVYIETEEP
jgi:nitrite reductase/ring-hydroxylating ferredoxin subunit